MVTRVDEDKSGGSMCNEDRAKRGGLGCTEDVTCSFVYVRSCSCCGDASTFDGYDTTKDTSIHHCKVERCLQGEFEYIPR